MTNAIQLDRRTFHRVALGTALAACGSKLLRAEERRDVPWLAEVQKVPSDLPSAPALRPLLVDAQGKTIDTLDGWLARRAELRRQWQEFLGTMDVDQDRRPTLEVVAEDRDAGVIR